LVTSHLLRANHHSTSGFINNVKETAIGKWLLY
jgi:hypothetical protein